MKPLQKHITTRLSRTLSFSFLAWRNLWRHKRRSAVVITSIVIAIFVMVSMMGLMNGITVQMIENTISTSLGHVAIHRKGYQDNMKLEYHFDPAALPRDLFSGKRNGDIVAAASRVKAQGMISSADGARGVLIVGIDPVAERRVSKICDYTMKENGSTFLTDPAADAILLSKSLAAKLGLELGDVAVIMLQGKDKKIINEAFPITGLFESPMEGFDKNVVFIGINKLQSLTGLGTDVSEVVVMGKDKDAAQAIGKELRSRIPDPGLEILSWKEMAPSLVGAVKLMDQSMVIAFIIFFITVVFSVANTLIMAIMERFHEIGVMKSIGTRPGWIFFMVVFEALNLGALGLVIGAAFALVPILILSHTGIDFSLFADSMRMWGTGAIIYPLIRVQDIVLTLLVVFGTNFIAAIYPAVKAARIKPLEALHFV